MASTYLGTTPKDLDLTTPKEGTAPVKELNDADREIKTVFLNDHTSAIKTANYSILGSDSVLVGNATSGITFTLPSAASVAGNDINGVTRIKEFTIYNINDGVITISGVVGNVTNPTVSRNEILKIWSDGTNFYGEYFDAFNGSATNKIMGSRNKGISLNSLDNTAFYCNAYYDGVSVRYSQAGTASALIISSTGSLYYYTAVSGVKDAVISWTGPYTIYHSGNFTQSNIFADEANLKIIRGYVNYAGIKINGSGYTAVRTLTGTYSIFFDNPFSSLPTAYIQLDQAGFSVPSFGLNGGSVYTSDITGATADRGFYFMLIGPR